MFWEDYFKEFFWRNFQEHCSNSYGIKVLEVSIALKVTQKSLGLQEMTAREDSAWNLHIILVNEAKMQ